MEAVGDVNPESPESEGRLTDEPASETSAMRAEMEKFKDLAYRAAAELENYKRRAVKDREEAMSALKEHMVSKMLLIVDGFDLAAAAAANVPEETQKKYTDGYQAIGRQLLSILEAMGLGAIQISINAEFHPEEQEAVMTEEVDGLSTPVVLQVLQKGYRLDGRLIRPARVKVGMPKAKEVSDHE